MDLNIISKNNKNWATKLLVFETKRSKTRQKNVLGACAVSAWLKFYRASKHQMPKVWMAKVLQQKISDKSFAIPKASKHPLIIHAIASLEQFVMSRGR